MKKTLLFLGIAAGMVSINAGAQLALENFNAPTLPAGWTLINDGHTVSTTFTGSTAIQDSLDNNAWWPVEYAVYTGIAGDYQMITTSDFTPAASANRWLITPSFLVSSPDMVIQWQDNALESTTENIEVKVSPTAGTTAPSFTSTIYSAPAGGGQSLVTHQAIIGGWSGSNITVAFRDTTDNIWGMVIDNVQTVVLNHVDLRVVNIDLPPFVKSGSSNNIAGVLQNYGIVTITSASLVYSINGGAASTTALSTLSMPLGSTYNYAASTPWVPTAPGIYTVKVWVDNLNGTLSDSNPALDTMTATISVLDTLQPKTVMIEEFNQASCDPCADAAPNVDSVYANNLGITAMVRYHVNFPGRDCMDSVTLSPFVQARLSLYNVSGVPDAQVDGQYLYPGYGTGDGYLNSANIQSAASFGSPFTMGVTAAYNSSTQTYNFTATIKSHGPIPAGLVAYAALTVDTITYAHNQSTESIPQTVFPQVAENMFPTSAGTTLGAFTDGSTQTVTSSWVKNHPWGSDYSVWSYDSTINGQIVVWIENDALPWLNNIQYVYQAAYAVVNTAHDVSVTAVTGNNASLDVYPNPTNKTATVQLNLNTAAEVKLEVYNVVGQLVYSMPAEQRNSGTSRSTIDVSNFASGEYFVKVTIGSDILNKTLTVTK